MVAVVVLSAIVVACIWKHAFLAAVWSGTTATIGTFFLTFSKNHPHLARLMHVGLDIVPDLESFALAIAGLAYLIPGVVKAVDASKVLRRSVFAAFVALAGITVMVNAINREQDNHSKEEQAKRIDAVSRSNAQILGALITNKGLTEAERRANVEKALRSEYVTTHDPIDPEVLAGNKMPPETWMNQRLHELGEHWTFAAPPAPPIKVANSHEAGAAISVVSTNLMGEIAAGRDLTLQINLAPLKREKPLEVLETTTEGEYLYSEDPLLQNANEDVVWNLILHGPPPTPLKFLSTTPELHLQ